LTDGEKLVSTTEANLGDVFRTNVILAVTNKRIIVRPKRGRRVDDDLREMANSEIYLNDISAVRRTGAITKHIEIEVGSDVVDLPPIQDVMNEIIDAIVSEGGLGKADWGDGAKTRLLKRLVIGVPAFIIMIPSAIGVLAGGILMITIVGFLPGLFVALGSLGLTYFSYFIFKWAFNKDEEWNRDTPPRREEPKVLRRVNSAFVRIFDNLRGIITHQSKKLYKSVNRIVPEQVWSYGVFAGIFLWMSLFPLAGSEYENLFGWVFLLTWVLLPSSIYFDLNQVRRHRDWSPRKWLYTFPAIVPFFGALVGFVWLVRKKQKLGSIFIYLPD
jgi:hypothetical protein